MSGKLHQVTRSMLQLLIPLRFVSVFFNYYFFIFGLHFRYYGISSRWIGFTQAILMLILLIIYEFQQKAGPYCFGYDRKVKTFFLQLLEL